MSSFNYPAPRTIKKALIIGINYVGMDGELAGCLNDALDVFDFHEQFGLTPANVRFMTDDLRGPRIQNLVRKGFTNIVPVKKNIEDALEWLVQGVQPGERVLFTISSHGTQTKDKSGDEKDGKDEAYCPLDYEKNGMILDDFMYSIVAKLPQGAEFIGYPDCCHSAESFDLRYRRKNTIVDGKTTSVPHPPQPPQSYPQSYVPQSYVPQPSKPQQYVPQPSKPQQYVPQPKPQQYIQPPKPQQYVPQPQNFQPPKPQQYIQPQYVPPVKPTPTQGYFSSAYNWFQNAGSQYAYTKGSGYQGRVQNEKRTARRSRRRRRSRSRRHHGSRARSLSRTRKTKRSRSRSVSRRARSASHSKHHSRHTTNIPTKLNTNTRSVPDPTYATRYCPYTNTVYPTSYPLPLNHPPIASDNTQKLIHSVRSQPPHPELVRRVNYVQQSGIRTEIRPEIRLQFQNPPQPIEYRPLDLASNPRDSVQSYTTTSDSDVPLLYYRPVDRVETYIDQTKKSNTRQYVTLSRTNSAVQTTTVQSNVQENTHYAPTNARVFIMSGCLDTGTSADATEKGKNVGAFSYCRQQVINQAIANKEQITWSQLHDRVLVMLKQKGYEQVPVLTWGRQEDPDKEVYPLM